MAPVFVDEVVRFGPGHSAILDDTGDQGGPEQSAPFAPVWFGRVCLVDTDAGHGCVSVVGSFDDLDAVGERCQGIDVDELKARRWQHHLPGVVRDPLLWWLEKGRFAAGIGTDESCVLTRISVSLTDGASFVDLDG
ncbi:MAG: hypothetical protein ACE367_13650 [Acidimicrobiales bacterium]